MGRPTGSLGSSGEAYRVIRSKGVGLQGPRGSRVWPTVAVSQRSENHVAIFSGKVDQKVLFKGPICYWIFSENSSALVSSPVPYLAQKVERSFEFGTLTLFAVSFSLSL